MDPEKDDRRCNMFWPVALLFFFWFHYFCRQESKEKNARQKINKGAFYK